MKFTPKMQEPELRILEEKMISLIKKGKNTAKEIENELKMDQFVLYRFLKRLEKEGIIIKNIHKKKGYIEHSTYSLPAR